MARKKILLIDDEPSICKFTKLNLERDGAFEVTTACSGKEGLEKALTEPFDLVITDFRMPEMDGKAVLDALKAARPECPVVLFSIYHDDASAMTVDIRNKADGIISKPIDNAALLRTISEALSRKPRPQPPASSQSTPPRPGGSARRRVPG